MNSRDDIADIFGNFPNDNTDIPSVKEPSNRDNIPLNNRTGISENSGTKVFDTLKASPYGIAPEKTVNFSAGEKIINNVGINNPAANTVNNSAPTAMNTNNGIHNGNKVYPNVQNIQRAPAQNHPIRSNNTIPVNNAGQRIPPVYSTGTATPVPNSGNMSVNPGNNAGDMAQNPNATRVIPRVPGNGTGNVVPNPNAARVMPRVQGNGTPGNITPNPNATRVMPRVQGNGTPGNITPNPNATRVMPRVQGNGTGNVVPNPNATRNVHGVPNGGAVNTANGSTRIMPKADTMPYGTPASGNAGSAFDASNIHTANGNPVYNNKTAGNTANVSGRNTVKASPSDKSPKRRKKAKRKGGVILGITKFVLYIAFVVVASVLLSKYLIGAGNDIFAFVKDTYNYTDTVYSTKGDATNSFRITETNLSGDKFEFGYSFGTPLTDAEKDNLDASILVVDAQNNYVVYNYGKYTDEVLKGNKIKLDLANANIEDSEYILRFTVGTGNNVYYITEFTLSKKAVDITLGENASTSDVAKILKENGIITHPTAFKLYAKLKKGDNKSLGSTYVAGSHRIYAGMDYDELLYALSPRNNVRSIVKLTFPEGSTVDEIIDILIKGGVKNSKADYIKAMENYEIYDYRFIELLAEDGLEEGRVYSLEGYMFPDTYEFYTDSSPEAVIDKFLSNFDAKFDASFYEEATKLGLTVDEVIRIASLVEAEAGNPDDKGNISSVFHNRLGNPSVFPKLESDATTDYASYNIKSSLKITEYKCSKCGKKDSTSESKCSECGNSNTYTEYKCASLNINLSNYNLSDGDYYINFTISSDTTRSKVLIYLNKQSVDGKAVFKITSNVSTNNPENGGDMSISIQKAQVDANGVLSCEFMLNHCFDSETFSKFPVRLNLFRTEYDTYNTNGLTPGPISNPGYESIIAALYPNSTNYYFFVAGSDGDSRFASTIDEHNKNISDLQRSGKAVTSY